METNDFTKVPNYFFEHMADMDKCEQSVVLLIIRKTLGYQKEWDRISFSQFIEDAGLGRASVDKGIDKALARGIIERREMRNSFEYRICNPNNGSKNEPIIIENSTENEPLPKENGSKNELNSGSKNEPISENGSKNEPKSVQKMNTQKKKENKNNTLSDDPLVSDDQDWFGAMCWLVYGHKDYKLLSDKDKLAVGKTIKSIRASPKAYTVADLRGWYRDKWSKEWPGKQAGTAAIQKPTLKQIKTGIGQVRPVSVNGFDKSASNKSIEVVGELER